ncbi:MAG: ABC transporter substrate-binding protein [Pseudomonadota bacterium]
MRKLARAFIATAAIAGLAALGGTASAQETRAVTFAQPSPSAINSFPVFVAIGEGFFADEGLDVTVESVNGSASVLQALSAGRAQFGRPGPGPVLNARARGVDVVFIYNVAAQSNFGILVEDTSEYQAPTDLKGTVVGVGTADGAEVSFARAVLEGAGMKDGADFEFLPVGDGGPATAAFMRGDVSAYAASTADGAIMSQRGLKMRDITPDEQKSLFGNGLATMRETIENDPELVEKFVRAFRKGHEFALDEANREAVLAHLAAGMPQESEDADFASALFTAVRSKTVPVDETKPLGYQPPAMWERWHTIVSPNLSAPIDDVSAAYTNDFTAQ